MSASEFADWFRRLTGCACPLPDELCPTVRREQSLWVSASLADVSLTRPMRPEFLDEPRDYILAGHWGHGIASYAVYYVSVAGPHRAFFRLPFGSVYGDTAQEGAYVAGYLEAYVAFRAAHIATLASSTLIHDLGTSWAELVRDGETLRLSDDELTLPSVPEYFFALVEESLERR